MRRRDFLKGLAAVVGCGVAGKAAATLSMPIEHHPDHTHTDEFIYVDAETWRKESPYNWFDDPTDWPAGNAEPGFDFWPPIAQARLPLA